MWAKIILVFEAIKGIASIFKTLKEMWDSYQEKKIHKHYDIKRRAVENTTRKIQEEISKPSEEQDDEKIKELHRKLVNLGKSV